MNHIDASLIKSIFDDRDVVREFDTWLARRRHARSIQAPPDSKAFTLRLRDGTNRRKGMATPFRFREAYQHAGLVVTAGVAIVSLSVLWMALNAEELTTVMFSAGCVIAGIGAAAAWYGASTRASIRHEIGLVPTLEAEHVVIAANVMRTMGTADSRHSRLLATAVAVIEGIAAGWALSDALGGHLPAGVQWSISAALGLFVGAAVAGTAATYGRLRRRLRGLKRVRDAEDLVSTGDPQQNGDVKFLRKHLAALCGKFPAVRVRDWLALGALMTVPALLFGLILACRVIVTQADGILPLTLLAVLATFAAWGNCIASGQQHLLGLEGEMWTALWRRFPSLASFATWRLEEHRALEIWGNKVALEVHQIIAEREDQRDRGERKEDLTVLPPFPEVQNAAPIGELRVINATE